VTLNRPAQMNAIPFQGHWDMSLLWEWFDDEPSLAVAIITGSGPKAFCAGQDLVEVETNRKSPPQQPYLAGRPPSGFAGMSQRRGGKPIIAAVNGVALGGGFEICLNWYTISSIRCY
jgi:enoyl-CoA hydratase/carnithine racemase